MEPYKIWIWQIGCHSSSCVDGLELHSVALLLDWIIVYSFINSLSFHFIFCCFILFIFITITKIITCSARWKGTFLLCRSVSCWDHCNSIKVSLKCFCTLTCAAATWEASRVIISWQYVHCTWKYTRCWWSDPFVPLRSNKRLKKYQNKPVVLQYLLRTYANHKQMIYSPLMHCVVLSGIIASCIKRLNW